MKYDPGYLFKNSELIACPLPDYRNMTGAPCFYSSKDILQYNQYPKKGALSYTKKHIRKHGVKLSYTDMASGRAYVILENNVLDMTDYLHSSSTVVKLAKGSYSRSFEVNRMFLPFELTVLLFLNLGSDVTELIDQTIPNPHIYKKCLQTLFFHGVLDGNTSNGCARVNVGLWITLGLFFVFFLIKMHMANLTQYSCIQRLLLQPNNPVMPPDVPYILLCVPFYSEPAETIRQTLDSLARTNYADSRKLLFFVCDGITQSTADTKDNYLSILDALGYSSTRDPELRAYVSLGQGSRKMNYARVYAGFYESGRNRVPFMMVVKVGRPTNTPGNRGKRDSILIALSFLERCLNLSNNLFNPLEFELYNQCRHLLGIDPRLFKYMLVTDADIQVKGDVVHRMVCRLEANPKTLALSGYIRPANPEENMMTMLQIFPVYMSYYSELAYESCLGGLMTINSGFVMYRIWNPQKTSKVSEDSLESQRKTMSISSSSSEEDEIEYKPRLEVAHQPSPHPISIHPTVLRGLATPQPDTMHMENLLLLGEEQYLALILLRSHPGHRLGFDPESVAYTTLPTHFFALQGLYLRSIRASLHIQLEFRSIARHLGFSYWVASLTKLLDTVFSVPIMVYLYHILFSYFVNKDIAYGTIACFFLGLIVLHIVHLLVYRQFKYIFWFVLYCLFGIPIFHIYLPILAIWRSDSAYQWYDVWPAGHEQRYRLHGTKDDNANMEEEVMHRMRLADFEHQEAEKNAIREREHVEMLDAKFNGFTGYIMHRPEIIPYPAAAQLRKLHRRYGSGESAQTKRGSLASTVDNPFDDREDTTLINSFPTTTTNNIQSSNDQDSCHYSLSNSILSLESFQLNEELEGRNAPVHSKLASYK